MYEIKKLEERYNQRVNEFIISILVEEYGFYETEEELKNENNMNYVIGNSNFWIAVDANDEVIGTIAVKEHDSKNIELKKFYVNQSHRGNGISKALYKSAIQHCEDMGFDRVFLGTYEKLEKAINFYMKRRLYRGSRIKRRKWCTIF